MGKGKKAAADDPLETAVGILTALGANPTWDLLGKDKLFKRLKAEGIVKTRAAFDGWWQARAAKGAGGEVHEVFARPQKRFKYARIAAPPYSFQIDVIRMDRYKRQNKGVSRFLLLVEIESRKAFAYVLKGETVPEVLQAYKRFLKDAGHEPFLVQGDDYFASKEFVDFNEQKNIPVFTSVAQDEHVTEGDPLGILDRLVQTLRLMIEKRIHARDDPKWTQWLQEVIRDYNSNPHETLGDDTPDAVYADINKLHARWVEDAEYNRDAAKPVAAHFRPGDYVRMRLAKGLFEKGATQTMSKEVYQVVSVRGTRIRLKTYPQGEALERSAKPNELLKVDQPAYTTAAQAAAPAAVTTANKEARRTRRLAKEGLPDVPLPKEKPAAATVSATVTVGQLVVVDAEGAADDDPSRLSFTDAGKTGYVFAGIVTKTARAKLYVKLLLQGSGTAISQKRLKLSDKSSALDNTHSDALLYSGDPPRIRSDGTTSLPAAVIAAVKAEYVHA